MKLIRTTFFLIVYLFLIVACSDKKEDHSDEKQNTELQIPEESLYIVQDHWIKCTNVDCELSDPYYEPGETVTWEGECKEGKAHGYGVMKKFINSELHSTYTGEYKSGIREGKGTFELNGKLKLESFFVNGQAIGQGTISYNNGNKYEGNIVNYYIHGIGVFTRADGIVERGLFNKGILITGKIIDNSKKVQFLQNQTIVEQFDLDKKPFGYKPGYKWDEATNNLKCELDLNDGSEITIYFDKEWNPWVNEENAQYKRKVKFKAQNIPDGTVKDYYISGELQNEFSAAYLDYFWDDLTFHEGDAKYYYKNNQVNEIIHYYNNQKNGKYLLFYEDGSKMLESFYKFGLREGKEISYYQNGKKKEEKNYSNDILVNGKSIEYEMDGVNAAIVYTQFFHEDKERWGPTEEYIDVLDELLNRYVMVNNDNKNDSPLRKKSINFDLNADYSIEVTLTKLEGPDDYGSCLYFGFKDWENFNRFIIAGNGQFSIDSYFENIKIENQKWKYSSSINTGNNNENVIKIFKTKNEFNFFINGNLVFTDNKISMRSGDIGISIPPLSKVRVEKLIVKEFVTIDKLNETNSIENSEEIGEWKGNGSGFFLSTNGYIATNFHVVNGANKIQVEYYQNGKLMKFPAKVVVTDKNNDLAIIKIEDPNYKTLDVIPYVFSSNISDVGESVFTLGYPISNVMGQEVKFTDGKISARTGVQGDVQMYQISVPIQPGNSGGPLFDEDGHLIGITSAGLNKEMFNAENVNYAIKSTYLKSLIDVLPEKIELPNYTDISDKNLKEKIKVLSNIVPIIKVN